MVPVMPADQIVSALTKLSSLDIEIKFMNLCPVILITSNLSSQP
jgi:hypothetical protein